MSEWKTIDLAPRDGTEILVYSKHAGMHVMLFCDGFFREKVSFCRQREEPTHWMLLPEPQQDTTDE